METGLYYYGARYLDSRTGRWISGDPAVGEYVPEAPVNDEARKRNGNLPGMGGVFNYVNLHVYHYAGNNPVKYVDPNGENIYNITFIGVGAKIVGGGGVTFGIAIDSNMQIAITTSINIGIGVEVTVDTPITPSFTVIEGKNLPDLPSCGPYRVSTGRSANASFIGGIIYDFDTNKIVGGLIGSIGGGVDLSLTIYFDFDIARDMISQFSVDTKQEFSKALETIKNSIPEEQYNQLQNFFKENE